MASHTDRQQYEIPDSEPSPLPYTMRIGVTGHRALDDPDRVYKAVEDLLCSIRISFEAGMHGRGKACTRVQWRVISPLARGADRIVARAAMEKLDASLDVVLPAVPDEYRKDFTDPGDLEEFNLLFEKAVNYPSLAAGYPFTSPAVRDGYEQAGRTLVDSCEILIAVWDGKPARGEGGTASAVSYACSVNRLVVWINALDPEAPPVIIVKVEEVAGAPAVSVSNKLTPVTRALPENASGWSPGFRQLEEYNRDKGFRKNKYDDVLMRNVGKLRDVAEKSGLDPGTLMPLVSALLPHYSRADSLALRYRKLHTTSAIWLYRLAAFSVTVAVFQTLFFTGQTGWTVLELLALTWAIVMFRVSIFKRWHEKYLNYRHLAERIRILLFQSVVGQQTRTESVLRAALPFYPGPGGWVPDVVSELKRDLPSMAVPEEGFYAVRKFVTEGWISDQVIYHQRNASVKERYSVRDRRIIIALLAGTLAAGLVHLSKLVHDPVMESLIISLVIILPSFASAQHAIGIVRDFERISTRSARMKELLQVIAHSMNNATGWEELKREMSHAEEIMATENHEWWVSLSFRRVSLPV